MKSVTGVRDGKHTHVSNLTISRDQLAYCGEREPREPKESHGISHLPVPREMIGNLQLHLYVSVAL